jgi:hypothetical protein
MRICIAVSAVAVVLAGCSDGEPTAAETATPTTTPVTESPTPTPFPVEAASSEVTTRTDPKAWCEQWWEQVVEADNENAAVGAIFLLAEEGINVDDELISSRSEILDYRTTATEDEIEQAFNDINLACSAYLAIDD